MAASKYGGFEPLQPSDFAEQSPSIAVPMRPVLIVAICSQQSLIWDGSASSGDELGPRVSHNSSVLWTDSEGYDCFTRLEVSTA